MNYSGNMNKRVKILIVVILTVSFVLGFSTGFFYAQKVQDAEPKTELKAEPAENVEPITLVKPEPQYIGEYTITAYCPCVKCCGKWALNRPDGVVYGASGNQLKDGVSVASPLPFGTKVFIDGMGIYTVEDRTSDWIAEKYNGKIIDVYFNSHEDAVNFGKQHQNVYVIKGE